MEILDAIDQRFMLQAFTVMFTVIYVSLSFFYIAKVRGRRAEQEEKLLYAISNGLANGQIELVEDLVNIYRGIHLSSEDDVSYKSGVSKVLRRLLVSLAYDKQSGEPSRRLKFKIKDLLKQIESEAPFADLPAAERNLILDAKKFIESNELLAASKKVDDLANLIEVRHDALERLQAANKWSVPLAVVGLVLTIVFGVASLR